MALFVGCNAGFQETYSGKIIETIREDRVERRWMLGIQRNVNVKNKI
jgi:hypothetical protein